VVCPQNQWDGFLRFSLKTDGNIFSGLASKLVATVSPSLTSKSMTTISPGWTSKPVLGFLVEPQN
jgi:hypothetical protein